MRFIFMVFFLILLHSIASAKDKIVILPMKSTAEAPAFELQCYTGEMHYTSTGMVGNFCSHTPVLAISTPYPSTTDPEEVFLPYCAAPSPYDDSNVMWGLRCKSGWSNTGCTASVAFYPGSSVEDGTAQFLNGCHMDDEEYGRGTVFTTCCRIAPVSP